MRKLHTWVLIADGGRARIVAHVAGARSLREVAGRRFEADHRSTHELVDDRQPRMYASTGERRSAIEPRQDPHRALKAAFANKLADVLADDQAAKAFDRLVIVAPPVLLGDLRSALSPAVKATVVAELDKDLTRTPDRELLAHLEDVLG
jgi:protein required for attachment to host cells